MAIRERMDPDYKSTTWMVDLRYGPRGSKRWRKSYATQAEAIAAEAQAKIDLLVGKEPKVTTGNTLGEIFDRVWELEWSRQKGARETRSVASIVVAHFGRECKLDKIDTRAINDFKLAFRSKGNSGSTINRKLAALSKLLRFAADEGLVEMPGRMKGEAESQGRDRFITYEEEAQLLALLRVWNQDDIHDLVMFLLDTGCRLGEALKLRWQDLNGPRVTFFDTKNATPRAVPMTKRVRAMLVAREKAGKGESKAGTANRYGTVFGLGVKRPLRKVWERAKAKLGLADDPYFVVHILRHTCASRLLQGGFDLEYVRRWLGHRSSKMTQRYAHLAVTSLDAGAEILERKPEGARHLAAVPNTVPKVNEA